MKKLLSFGILAGLITITASAHAGGRFSFHLGIPPVSVHIGSAPRPVYVRPAPVYCAPAPVYVAPPAVMLPPPVYVRPAPVFVPRRVVVAPRPVIVCRAHHRCRNHCH